MFAAQHGHMVLLEPFLDSRADMYIRDSVSLSILSISTHNLHSLGIFVAYHDEFTIIYLTLGVYVHINRVNVHRNVNINRVNKPLHIFYSGWSRYSLPVSTS